MSNQNYFKKWWDFPYNPAKGCNGPAGDGVHCPYCYAKNWVKRCNYAKIVASAELNYKIENSIIRNECEAILFYNDLIEKIKSFKPHFFEYVLAQKLRIKPTIYFFSMSDPADWEPSWHEKIVEKIRLYPQHKFVVLTKRPKVYEKYVFPENVWCGVTITSNKDWRKILHITELNISNITFCSIEPIQEKIEERNIETLQTGNWSHYKEEDGEICTHYGKPIDWLIVGPETGTKKKTPGEWLDLFFSLKDISVFMKTACSQMTDRKLRQEWPDNQAPEIRKINCQGG